MKVPSMMVVTDKHRQSVHVVLLVILVIAMKILSVYSFNMMLRHSFLTLSVLRAPIDQLICLSLLNM